MKDVDLYAKVRHAVRIEGLSERAAARRFGIDARTVHKMMKFSVPPGYRRSKPPVKPKLGRSGRLPAKGAPSPLLLSFPLHRLFCESPKRRDRRNSE